VSRPALRRLLAGSGGLALGAALLWLALREADFAAMGEALRMLDGRFVALSCVLYWLGLACRVGRWHGLLAELDGCAVPGRRAVAEVLVVGYAVNNVLPARLGELFRADYAKRRFAVSRSSVLGTIVIERLADLAAILACLALGLLGLRGTVADGLDFPGLLRIAAVIVALLAGGVLVARRGVGVALPAGLARRLQALAAGLRVLNRASLGRSAALTGLVWAAEVGALWAMLAALGVALSPAQAMLVMSAASLSTLVPTAPGYLGTYQLVFAAALPVFGESASLGVLGSGLIQICLFGSVTIAGLLLYLGRAMHNMRPLRNEAPLGGTEYRSP
jgi:uncharacterized membrane protein YbhN (UPF0104 family)